MTEISEYLTSVLSDVQEAGIPEILMPLAFEEALRLGGGNAKPSGDSGSEAGSGWARTPPASGDDGSSRVAVRFGLEVTQVSEVFVERDEEISLGIGAK